MTMKANGQPYRMMKGGVVKNMALKPSYPLASSALDRRDDPLQFNTVS